VDAASPSRTAHPAYGAVRVIDNADLSPSEGRSCHDGAVNQAEPEDAGRAADATGHGVSFEEIISGWIAEGTVPTWPDGVPHPTEAPETAVTDETAVQPPAAVVPPPACAPVTPAQPPEVRAFDEHFIPPDPPPMPRIGVTASIGLALLGFGIVLLALPAVLGSNSSLGLPLGLVSLALGLGWLVLRSWPSVPDDGGDDGAVL
jgi:hypothetical protein